ncbi:MAG TPA: DUF4174 domain-containing protein [Acidisarcina sp.]
MSWSRLVVWCVFAVLSLRPGALGAQSRPDCPLPPSSFASMRTCYRPLLVFSPAAEDWHLEEQQALLDQYADEMLDRFILYVPVLSRKSGFVDPLDAPFALLPEAETEALRRRFWDSCGRICCGSGGRGRQRKA